MAPSADPWRTLGLAPGATQDEIRRAYRRLAKINHPDAGGDGALPRFLAIQQAYDELAGPGRIRRSGARPAPGTPPAADPREPWRADPGRARASGRADGGRAPGARPAGSRPTGPDSRPPAPDSPGAAGAAGSAAGGPAAGPGSDGAGTRRSSSRRRAPNRATPGSTSYEGADLEPFEPGWSGATWYGASSGTYWTINPKEYADPRKHGPEYQARARRAAQTGRIEDGAIEPDAPDGLADPGPESATGLGGDDDRGPEAAPGADTDGPRSSRASSPPSGARMPPTRPAWTSAAAREAGADVVGEPRESSPGTESEATSSPYPSAARPSRRPAAQQPGDVRQRDPGAPDLRPGDGSPPARPPLLARLRDLVEEPSSSRFRAPYVREPTTPMGRLAMAVFGWPPLGIFLAAAIDNSTGCGRYAASCSEISSPGTWIVNAMLVLLLLALPRLATWSAHGTIVAIVVGLPSAVALSAGGGSNVPEASGPVLIAVLALAYLAGVAYAVVRQVQLRSGRVAAGSRVP